MLTKVDLGNSSIDYIYSQLKHGNTYAHILLRNGYRGFSYTFLPQELQGKQIEYLRSVQLTTGFQILPEARNMAVDFVTTFLQDKNRITIIETYYHPKDISRLEDTPSITVFNNEVYYLLRSNENRDIVIKGFSSARDYPFICGLVDVSEMKSDVSENQSISENLWSVLVEKTKHIIIGAFDAEGYLIWTRY